MTTKDGSWEQANSCNITTQIKALHFTFTSLSFQFGFLSFLIQSRNLFFCGRLRRRQLKRHNGIRSRHLLKPLIKCQPRLPLCRPYVPGVWEDPEPPICLREATQHTVCHLWQEFVSLRVKKDLCVVRIWPYQVSFVIKALVTIRLEEWIRSRTFPILLSMSGLIKARVLRRGKTTTLTIIKTANTLGVKTHTIDQCSINMCTFRDGSRLAYNVKANH